MLSMEFIPTSPSDEDFVQSTRSAATSKPTDTNSQTISTTKSSFTVQKIPVGYSTNPEGIKFVPQPPVQFYYSLQKNSLRTVIDTLLSTTELGHICTVFRVPCYGKWLKKKMAADMLVDYLLTLKQAYQRERFNEIVDKINAMKGKEMLGRIPRLPERIDALKMLKRSLLLANKFSRPTFPVRLNSPLKEVTGMIFLDEVEDDRFKNSFTLDFYFTIPLNLEHTANIRFIFCVYQKNDQNILTTVSPTLLDLTLNGSNLELGNCRFRNHDSYDITLFCYKDRANLMRILRHETHVDLKNLVVEVVAISIAGSLSESRPLNASVKRPHEQICEDERISQLRDRYLKEDIMLRRIDFDQCLALLRSLNAPNQADELEILEDTLSLSLKCPITFTRIRQPVKFRSCRHGQCFDLSNWKQISQNILNLRINSLTNSNSNSKKKPTAKISCPICGTSVEEDNARHEELIVDGLFEKALKMAESDDVAIKLDLKDGSFTFEKEAIDDDDEEEEDIYDSDSDNNSNSNNNDNDTTIDIISISDSDEDSYRYPIDKSKPLGSCPSRAISLD